MIEVANNLFVGAAVDLMYIEHHDGLTGDTEVAPGWHVISAARDPWHRKALGYTTRGAPKDSPEYLVAHRKNRTILNLVDAADPAYISDQIIDVALDTINMHLAAGEKVLIHCNEGKSRAPTIAMLWLWKTYFMPRKDEGLPEIDAFVRGFKSDYPDYAPAEGMRLYAQRWLEKNLTAA